MNDQFMWQIELASEHEGLKVISYAMEQLPLNVIINGGVKHPKIANKYVVKLLRKASTKTTNSRDSYIGIVGHQKMGC